MGEESRGPVKHDFAQSVCLGQIVWCFFCCVEQIFLFEQTYPIGSDYGIFTFFLYHRNSPNVGKYAIHGSNGYKFSMLQNFPFSTKNFVLTTASFGEILGGSFLRSCGLPKRNQVWDCKKLCMDARNSILGFDVFFFCEKTHDF